MNIFYLSNNPKTCAQMHNDSHCSKMIIEYAQLMSTAHRFLDGEKYYGKTANGRKIARWLHPDPVMEATLYKASHVKHPSGIWTRKSKQNYRWLYSMWTELNTEFMYRYNKNVPHESFRKLEKVLEEPPKHMYDSGFCEPYPAMPDDVKYDSSIKSYHEYYIKYKQHLAKWTKRGEPYWYGTERLELRTA